MRKIVLFSAVVVGFVAATSCEHKVGALPVQLSASQLPDSCSNVAKITYSKEIKHILTTYCGTAGNQGSCHQPNVRGGGGDFTTYSGLTAMPNASNGWISTLKDRISPNPSSGNKMPSSLSSTGVQTLTDCEYNQLLAWLNAGAPNN